MPDFEKIQAVIESEYSDDGVESAKSSMGSFGEVLGNIGTIAAGMGLERLAEQVITVGESFFQAGIQAATALEGMRVNFETAFGGSAKAADGMIKALDDLSYKTPFASEQLDTLALRLKNNGAEASKIPGVLSDIADIAAGTGTSFQQMGGILETVTNQYSNAVSRGGVSTMQLRALQNQGIPIYDAIVTVLNKQGGVAAESAKALDKHAKTAANNAEKHAALAIKIQEAEKSLKLLEATHAKEGLATEKHNFAIEKAKQNLKELNAAYDDTGKVSEKTGGKMLVTKDMLLHSSKDLKITADQLQQALQLLGEGKYLGSAQKQADTFAGAQKNIQASLQDTAKAILGIGEGGDVQKGGLFDTMRNSALQLFNVIKSHKGDIVAFFQQLMGAGRVVIGYFKQIVDAVAPLYPLLQPALNLIGQAFGEIIPPIMKEVNKLFKEHKDTIMAIAVALGGAFVGALILAIGLVGGLIILGLKLTNFFLGLPQAIAQGMVQGIIWFSRLGDQIKAFFSGVGDAIKKVGEWFKSFASFKFSLNIDIPGNIKSALHAMKVPGFANGVQNFAGGLAMVGERGPEMVYLPQGSSVIPNQNINRATNITMNNNVNSQADWSSVAKEIGWRVNGR